MRYAADALHWKTDGRFYWKQGMCTPHTTALVQELLAILGDQPDPAFTVDMLEMYRGHTPQS